MLFCLASLLCAPFLLMLEQRVCFSTPLQGLCIDSKSRPPDAMQ